MNGNDRDTQERTKKLLLTLDNEVFEELDQSDINIIGDEIIRKRPEFKTVKGPGPLAGGKNAVEIITAAATLASSLAPIIVPIVKEVLKRFFPLREVNVVIERKENDLEVLNISWKES